MIIKRYDMFTIHNAGESARGEMRPMYEGEYIAFEDHEALVRKLTDALKAARDALEGEPEYHHSGMGCGLEDRSIHDRYDAMHHGWECALERVYGEHVNPAVDVINAALSTTNLSTGETPQ